VSGHSHGAKLVGNDLFFRLNLGDAVDKILTMTIMQEICCQMSGSSIKGVRKGLSHLFVWLTMSCHKYVCKTVV
jgi:hypothetical protein